jgi:hypothetical protein
MMQTSLPDAVRSPERLAALHELALLDTPPEETFDRLTRLAARLLQVPVALVTLVDEDRQFFKSSVGLGEPWASRRQMPLAYSFCQHAVADKQTLVISDARNNDRVKNSPAVSENNSLAYVGVPLITDKGHALGTLCVVDSSPRLWDDDQVQVLSDLAAVVMDEIRLRQAVCDLARHALIEQEARHAREAAEAALRQRAFVRDVLRNVTEGRLRLCDSPMDLPPALAPVGDPIPLRPATLQTFRQAIRTAAERYNMAAERAADLIAAAGEASMNVVVHAQNGAGRVCADPGPRHHPGVGRGPGNGHRHELSASGDAGARLHHGRQHGPGFLDHAAHLRSRMAADRRGRHDRCFGTGRDAVRNRLFLIRNSSRRRVADHNDPIHAEEPQSP